MRIGIFDSGIGGEAIAHVLRVAFPDATIDVVNDMVHVPYGDRNNEDIVHLTDTAIQPLLTEHPDVIVIACNTATAAAIEQLRFAYPDQKFIGIEPMVKPAATLTKTNVVAVCATPATLNSERYKRAKQLYGAHVRFIEPDCSSWAKLIEENKMTKQQINASIIPCIELGADVIVLGCTHYHWIKGEVEQLADTRATVLEPSESIAKRVHNLLKL